MNIFVNWSLCNFWLFLLQFECSGKASHGRQGEGGEDRAADERKRLGKKRKRKKKFSAKIFIETKLFYFTLQTRCFWLHSGGHLMWSLIVSLVRWFAQFDNDRLTVQSTTQKVSDLYHHLIIYIKLTWIKLITLSGTFCIKNPSNQNMFRH